MFMQRVVLDSSVLVAAMKSGEPNHADALDLLARLRSAGGAVEIFAPPELWLEARVAAMKFERSSGGAPVQGAEELLAGLSVELTPMTRVEEIDEFFGVLAARVRGKAPFANATDLVYLWVAWQRGAALITLDSGLLKYHGVVCDVVRPFHVHFG
jgi:predicted nucleic acid-binding protein